MFLDRDGVINAPVVRDGKPYPPASVETLEILPGVHDALVELGRADFLRVMVTNQPDVRRGTQTRSAVDAIHQRLRDELPIDAVYCCFHDDVDACTCRKPAPGMLFDAVRDHAIDLPRSFMVGDRWRDTEAGRAAGCMTVFIDYRYAERQPQAFDRRVSSLAEAAAWILGEP